MKRIFGYTLMPMLGAVALMGACQLEPPASTEWTDDFSVAPEVASEATSDVAASTMQPARSCNDDDDCRDGDRGTIDWCDPSNECEHQERDECEDRRSDCDNNRDCRDGDRDTKDWCHRGKCHHADRDTGECKD